ncbi:hypothetical protein NPIL_670521 [Nephila pilipes]|uniref:Uncharacterized protein n=1 Tax=Nephila pilipes TaxID=299642 RepID=A0A8X6PG26_NEPPI|nr:hypothetical protein NPIL_670521 [Nephila pilipes]
MILQVVSVAPFGSNQSTVLIPRCGTVLKMMSNFDEITELKVRDLLFCELDLPEGQGSSSDRYRKNIGNSDECQSPSGRNLKGRPGFRSRIRFLLYLQYFPFIDNAGAPNDYSLLLRVFQRFLNNKILVYWVAYSV